MRRSWQYVTWCVPVTAKELQRLHDAPLLDVGQHWPRRATCRRRRAMLVTDAQICEYAESP